MKKIGQIEILIRTTKNKNRFVDRLIKLENSIIENDFPYFSLDIEPYSVFLKTYYDKTYRKIERRPKEYYLERLKDMENR